MILINSFSISRLNNAEITGFFINVEKLINDADTEKLGVAESTITAYSQTLLKLIDQVYTTTGSAYTAEMKAADEKRDLIFKRIRLKLQAVDVAEEGSPLLDVADVVRVELLAKYNGRVPQMPYQEETAIIKGFLHDLRTKLDSDAQEMLSIDGDMFALEEANNAFVTAYTSRSGERAEGDTGLTIRLRNEMTDLFTSICLATQFFANSTDPAHSAKLAECEAFIKKVNVELIDSKRRFDARTKKSDDSTPEDDNPQQPGGNNQQPSSNNQQSGSAGDSNAGNNAGNNPGSNPGEEGTQNGDYIEF